MKTLLTGCSGLVGSALIEYLFQKGHCLQCLKHNKNQQTGKFWAIDKMVGKEENVFQTVIHLAGENVGQGRWTRQKKQNILSSRLEGTRQLVDYLAARPQKPLLFLCASAVGYYGDRGDEILNENSSQGQGFLADVCRQWEQESQRLTSMGVRVVNLRFGMILSPKGGTLQKMIPPFQARLGGVIGSGTQHISWVSIRDLVEIVGFIIKNESIKGPVNVVSPIQTTNRGLTKALGKALQRPTLLKMPPFVARLVWGRMADELLLSSTRVTPQVLLESGYEFKDQSLGAVLDHCLTK